MSVLFLSVFIQPLYAVDTETGFVEDPGRKNLALLVGVSHGLFGIDKDIKNIENLIKHPAYQYRPVILQEDMGTHQRISKELEALSRQLAELSSLFFYFSGHGDVGVLMVQDMKMKISELRASIEMGRQGLPPIERLVMMFDSCYSGSLLDPIRASIPVYFEKGEIQNLYFVESVVNEFVGGSEVSYWKKLFAFASSRADQTSFASPDGSHFTLALLKAFDEAAKQGGTVSEFIQKTHDYTQGHNPIARVIPASWNQEKVVP